MKVVCIISNEYTTPNLRVGEIYDITLKAESSCIINDNNDHWYPRKWFRSLHVIRNEKIDKLLENEDSLYI
jgi:signal recognition particle subunit SEC65